MAPKQRPASAAAAGAKQPRCKAKTEAGDRCSNPAKTDGFCGVHFNQKLRKAAAASEAASSNSSRVAKAASISAGLSSKAITAAAGKKASAVAPKKQAAPASSSTSTSSKVSSTSSTATSQQTAARSDVPAGIRTGAPGEDICAEKVLFSERLDMAGVNGSSADNKPNWLRLWEKHTKRSTHLQGCAALGCTQSASCGGHVWLKSDRSKKHCYIVPLCARHNNRDFDYPWYFESKANLALMRISSHVYYFE